MIIETSHFGPIEIDELKILTFPQGIPGFEHLSRYVMIHPEQEQPFSFMQSVEEEGLVFIVTNPFTFFSDYDFELPDSVVEELKITSDDQVIIWSVVTIRDSIESATVNLMAPIVVNTEMKTGKQVILHGTEYLTKHPLILNKIEIESRAEG